MRHVVCVLFVFLLPACLQASRWDQWFARAQAHLESGRYEQTAAIAAYVLRQAHGSAARESAWYLLAAAFFQAGLPRTAAAAAFRHMGKNIHPAVRVQAARFLGRLFWYCLENQEQALYIADLSWQLCAGCFEAYYRLGYCFTYLLPDAGKARYYFTEGLRRFPAQNWRSRSFLSGRGN